MSLSLKPTHATVKAYYAALNQFGQLHFDNEAQVSDAFVKLLSDCGRKLHLTFIPQFPIERAKNRVIVDGLCSTPSTSLTVTGRPRTEKTISNAKSRPSSTRATPATTSSSRPPSARSFTRLGP